MPARLIRYAGLAFGLLFFAGPAVASTDAAWAASAKAGRAACIDHPAGVQFAPLLGWYDYSFGEPSEALRDMWMDFRACRWPPRAVVRSGVPSRRG